MVARLVPLVKGNQCIRTFCRCQAVTGKENAGDNHRNRWMARNLGYSVWRIPSRERGVLPGTASSSLGSSMHRSWGYSGIVAAYVGDTGDRIMETPRAPRRGGQSSLSSGEEEKTAITRYYDDLAARWPKSVAWDIGAIGA